jgi:hypothetical protein
MSQPERPILELISPRLIPTAGYNQEDSVIINKSHIKRGIHKMLNDHIVVNIREINIPLIHLFYRD